LRQPVSWLILPRKLTLIALLVILLSTPAAYSAGNLSVTVTTNKEQYSPGEAVTVTGKVVDSQNNPVAGATVSIQIDDPSHSPIYAQAVASDSSGAYSLSFTLPSTSAQGQYAIYVTASTPGNNNGQAQVQFTVTGSQTSSSTTSQQPSKCFVASATYGSELSPEVSLLRSFRDSEILQTYAGSNFMLAFNAFYYSFSPQVALSITTHALLRAVMKGVLYPLVGIMYVADKLFAALSLTQNTELAVTLTGIFASTAIGFVYAGPVAVALSQLNGSKKRGIQPRVGRTILGTCMFSIAWLIVAEALHVGLLMILSSAAVVLSSLALGAFVMFRVSGAVMARQKHSHSRLSR
jgi:hypothetical protein